LRFAVPTRFPMGFPWPNSFYTMLKSYAITVFFTNLFEGTIEWE